MKKENKKNNVSNDKNWREKFLRVNADFQNYKRRMELDQAKWIQSAHIDVIMRIIPFIDEFNLAIQFGEKHEGDKDWLDGFKMIYKNLKKNLADFGVSEIDCSGKFDPDIHEAIMQVESKDHKSGDIVSIISEGYMLNDKVIRHAKVSVAK